MPCWLPILSGRHYLLCLELQARCNAMVIVLMGTLMGVGGGVIRDILTNQVPFIFR
ncbi:TRIC cation channel family protein [Perlucidibaca aquatica]|uniref:TRIC cation channel family protein n=1 Tax=Perlucidibaca aquatica TaxID=1852776 RepID=UPI001D0CECD5